MNLADRIARGDILAPGQKKRYPPAGGSVGQVLKRTADGVRWGDAEAGAGLTEAEVRELIDAIPTPADGIDGNDGTNGSSFLSGTGAPASSLGRDGDTYLNTATGLLYSKAAGAWTQDGDLGAGAAYPEYGLKRADYALTAEIALSGVVVGFYFSSGNLFPRDFQNTTFRRVSHYFSLFRFQMSDDADDAIDFYAVSIDGHLFLRQDAVLPSATGGNGWQWPQGDLLLVAGRQYNFSVFYEEV